MEGSTWGGSEELWWAAAMRLHGEGVKTSASVRAPLPQHPKLQQLAASGIKLLHQRPPTLLRRVLNRALRQRWPAPVIETAQWLKHRKPSLVVLNTGFAVPDIDLMEMCIANAWPFVTISHVNNDQWWPTDAERQKYQRGMHHARRCYFVSRENLNLAQKQIGFDPAKAEVVRNPFGVPYENDLPWPAYGKKLRMACVGRLEPGSKGQDLLIEALAKQGWQSRDWCLNIYGNGPTRVALEELIKNHSLEDRVFFRGYEDPVRIWSDNHVLIQPSRFEGLPITIVEAMLCARTVLVTDVAGNSELVDDGITGFVAEAPTVKHIAASLEQLWTRRSDLQRMGQAASHAVRKSVDADPAQVFVNKLREMAPRATGLAPLVLSPSAKKGPEDLCAFRS